MIPQTTDYMVLGFVATGLIMAFQVVSMVARWRSLRADEAVLDEEHAPA